MWKVLVGEGLFLDGLDEGGEMTTLVCSGADVVASRGTGLFEYYSAYVSNISHAPGTQHVVHATSFVTDTASFASNLA